MNNIKTNNLCTVNAYSVTQISLKIKTHIENFLQNIQVEGEICNIKIASSGHIYASLKDEGALINMICWRYIAIKLPIQLKCGMNVICTGNIATYLNRSNYQIIVKNINLVGQGLLLSRLAKIKQKLKKEGIFDNIHKKIIPSIPKKIGIIASFKGAVIQDVLHRLKNRFPTQVIIWDTVMQGNQAAACIAEAVNGLNNLPDNISAPDIIIVARGGGSTEDLWPLNEEIVLRSIYKSEIPIVSAIGHESDNTLIDLVADVRASTPTAAAELITPNKANINEKLNEVKITLNNILFAFLNLKSIELKNLLIKLKNALNNVKEINKRLNIFLLLLGHKIHYILKKHELRNKLIAVSDKKLLHVIDNCQNRMNHSLWKLTKLYKDLFNKLNNNINLLIKIINSCSYKNILKKGFVLIKNKHKRLLTSSMQLHQHELIEIKFHNHSVFGYFKCKNLLNKKNK